ncbi:calcium-dependent lipid-binding family protein [Tanacetum coccineum]
MQAGDLNIGSVRQVNVKSGLLATTSTERLELLDDDEHFLGIKIIDGDHRLKVYYHFRFVAGKKNMSGSENYSSILTVHPEIIEKRSGTFVNESFVANIVAAFARTSREDSQKLLAPEYYPSWVALIVLAQSFLFLQLTWLNSHLTKIWPHVNEAASELIKANVEPVLDQYRPIVLYSLTFSKLTLGTVAPQFTSGGVALLYASKEFEKLQTTNFDQKVRVQINQTLLSELSNEVGFPVTNMSFDALLESLLSIAKPFPQSAVYRILAS